MDAVARSGSSSSSKVASTDWLPMTRMFGSSTIVDAARRRWASCSRFTRSPRLDQPGGRYRWWPRWAAHGPDASGARRRPRPVNAPLARSPRRKESSGAVPTLPVPEMSARRQPRRLRRRAPLAIGPTSVPSCPAPGAGPAGAADSHPPARARPLGFRPARPAPPGATTTNVPDHASVCPHARLRAACPAPTAEHDDVTRPTQRSGRRGHTGQRRADGTPRGSSQHPPYSTTGTRSAPYPSSSITNTKNTTRNGPTQRRPSHVRDLCLLSSVPTGAPLSPGVLVTDLVTSAVARSLLPREPLNMRRSWSPPVAELHRQPPGVPYEVPERRSSPGGSTAYPRAGDHH